MKKYFNISYWLRKVFVSKIIQKFFSKKFLNKLVFYLIYKSNHWNRSATFDENTQSVSGPGSAPNSKQTLNILNNLTNFLKKENIKSILDAPCGDCAWIKPLFKNNILYTGMDIVDELINKNKNTFYKFKNVNFRNEDIVSFQNFNEYEFVFLRDFFIHLPFEDIKKVINNLRKSKCKFYCFESYEKIEKNNDIIVGQHRKINFLLPPFLFDQPYFKILEQLNEDYPDLKDNDKYLYIFKN